MKTTLRTPRTIRIRAARITDASPIAALSEQLGYPCSTARLRRRLRNLLEDHDSGIWVAEVEDETVAGWIHVFIKQVLESDREAEIGGLVIDKAFRNQGVGRALVQRAERWAKARRLKSVYLRSNIVRKDSHGFYERLGYKIIKTQYAFRKSF